MQYDVDASTLDGKDALTQTVARRACADAVVNTEANACLDRQQLAGIDQLAEQGFGQRVKRLTDGPLHGAAKHLDVDLMACLLRHDFDALAEGARAATPDKRIAHNSVPITDPARKDRMERCANLLRAASARQAARQALTECPLSDAPDGCFLALSAR